MQRAVSLSAINPRHQNPVTTPPGSSMTGAVSHAGPGDQNPDLRGYLEGNGGWPVVLGEFRRDLADDGHGSVAGGVNPGPGGIGKGSVDPPPGDRVEPLFRGRHYAFHGPSVTAGQPSRTLQLGTPRPSEWVHAAKPDRAQEPNDPMSADTASHAVRLGPEELSALTARRRAAQPRMQTTQ